MSSLKGVRHEHEVHEMLRKARGHQEIQSVGVECCCLLAAENSN